MTQVFDEEGKAVPVTVIQAGPCVVVNIRTPERDGYAALQLGHEEVRGDWLNRPLRGQFTKGSVKPQRFLREIRVEVSDLTEFAVGQEIRVDIFNAGDYVDVRGTSKGKGFAGGIKRHGMHRGPMQHGSKYHRRPGSLGSEGPRPGFQGAQATRQDGRRDGFRSASKSREGGPGAQPLAAQGRSTGCQIRTDPDQGFAALAGKELMTMPKAALYNVNGERVGDLDLSDQAFGATVNKPVLHQAVVRHLANRRLGTADTKTRGEVQGTTRKPWRQKGTGRARAGSFRSPLWRSGGIVLGRTRASTPRRCPRKCAGWPCCPPCLPGPEQGT